MKTMTLNERAQNYSTEFPNYPPLAVSERWLYGIWMIGNFYKNKTSYYGAYPHSYLKRILSLFPDKKNILHLFSGSLDGETEGTKFDIDKNCKPDVIGDAHKLTDYFKVGRFDLILADPPYSDEDAEHYGTPMINRNTVVKKCAELLPPRGFLVWLDQTYPMYRKAELKLVGTIGLIRSTNHRVRMIFIFERTPQVLNS